MSRGCEWIGDSGVVCISIKSLKDSNSWCWDFRRVVRKTSKWGLSLNFVVEVGLRGVRVIFFWSFWKE